MDLSNCKCSDNVVITPVITIIYNVTTVHVTMITLATVIIVIIMIITVHVTMITMTTRIIVVTTITMITTLSQYM